jgi:hypothetical protein
MSQEPKIRVIGARKVPTNLTIESLVNFAERVIRTDKEAAMKAQKTSSDVMTPSNDRTAPDRASPRISTLSELSGRSGAVKIKSDSDADESSDKLINFGRKSD